MQCAACRAVYSNALDICPRCQRPKHAVSPALTKEATTASHQEPKPAAKAMLPHHNADDAQTASIPAASATATGGGVSTLIEFPGTGRANANRPQWRKELSERVREIQLRRAREAALEAEQAAIRELEQAVIEAEIEDSEEDAPPPPLGLVASNDAAPLNPLVVAALRRIERARQPPPRPRVKSSGAAAAVARVVEEHYETPVEPEVAAPPPPRVSPITLAAEIEARPIESPGRTAEAPRPSGLIIVQPVHPPKVEPRTEPQTEPPGRAADPVLEVKTAEVSVAPPPPVVSSPPPVKPRVVVGRTTIEPTKATPDISAPPAETVDKPVPRRVCAGVIDDHWLERREAEMHASANPSGESVDDRAPLVSRFVGGLVDLLLVAFIAAPFAAVIELTSGEWSDPRVAGSMAGILITLIILYMVVSTGLTGRTLGMWLMSLRVVDVRTAMVPATGQSVRRAVAYVISLAAFGLGFFYALFDAEGRAAHDHLSGTVVVRD